MYELHHFMFGNITNILEEYSDPLLVRIIDSTPKHYQSRLQFNAQPNSAHPTITQDPITSTYNTHLKSKSKFHDFTDFADGGLSTP